MKHGTSAVTSGTLPVMQNSPRKSSSTARSSAGVSMTSTTGLRQAGAKKCVTVAWFLWRRSAKIRAAGSEEAFEVIQASGAHQRFKLRENLSLQCEVFGRGFDRPIGVARDRVIGRGMNVGARPFRPRCAHLAARDGFFRVFGEALHGAVQRWLRNVDQIKFQIGQGGFQVIADVGADGAGADHDHAARQRARGFSQTADFASSCAGDDRVGAGDDVRVAQFPMAPKS